MITGRTKVGHFLWEFLKFTFANSLLETQNEEATNEFDCGLPDHGHCLCTKQLEICQYPVGN